ncbi:serine/arginine repetitive matrix protein 1 [Pectinophora gossypiella]|nr:serine/arginine repetitive matrix protein 1 [Pectinophora gossypiella]
MVSTLSLEEKYNRVRRNFCFYLDIQEHGLARSLSRRLQDMGLQQEAFLSSRVTHVVREPAAGGAAPRCNAARTRADAMLQRARPPGRHHPHLVTLTVHKAITLLDKLYDTFFAAPRKAHVKLFSKHYLKIEFLDKVCRPVYKEFDEWPEISLEPDPPKEKREKKESTTINQIGDINQNQQNTAGQKMTRKSRPRIKEKEEKEPKGGYCEMCNADYVDPALHRRSPHHLAFVRDHTNFLALDSLIGSGADVTTFLDKATPLNGERRSLRKMCNGDEKSRRSKRSQSPDSTVNGNQSPKRNGGLDDERRHNTRCSKRSTEAEDRQYYKVVGVSTKLRSSGGFATRRKDSPPACNGTKPLVVKFRKVRRSELSVLSDEAEQFMFPKRASSDSESSSEEDAAPPPAAERRRLARPGALKEDSSDDDGWPDHTRRRKRRPHPPVKRGRRLPLKPLEQPEPKLEPPEPEAPPPPPPPQPEVEVNPLREEPTERCMKWQDGKLTYTPAVEQLEFAFESVPRSEPWFETFKRQDEDRVLARNVPQYFALYSNSPKLPYEIGQLPPLKPNCCPLSDLVKREEKPGPSRSYGTRGMKKQKIRKRTAAILALEGHSRKSPREHASTLAILGSVGLLHRRKNGDDAKSTASEDTISDTHSTVKIEPVVSEAQEASERLQQFLSEVFSDAAEYEVSAEAMEGEAVPAAGAAPDVARLVSDCDACDVLRHHLQEGLEARARSRRGKFKKKNRTGWPNKKKPKKDSRTDSSESQKAEGSVGRSSAEPDEDPTREAIGEEDTNPSETEEKTLIELKNEEEARLRDGRSPAPGVRPRRRSLDKRPAAAAAAAAGAAPVDERVRARRALAGLLLQPVVRVARVDPAAARHTRSAARAPPAPRR